MLLWPPNLFSSLGSEKVSINHIGIPSFCSPYYYNIRSLVLWWEVN
jgi:hypothetical protein